ncbi:MAG TPA: type II toxin-antitoxin system death-on-curing family toxin [Lacipirellulaceae bacterium]|nr:type II toxin-antitoxin system death-on-curing family toxin [Lacipirellulaceae bacterium]
MDEPQWIEEQAVLEIHAIQLEQHGGMTGIRDAGLLSSALNRPRNLWAYAGQSSDMAAIAAVYAAGIAKNHPFLDGNKRTAAVVCELFLDRNGYELIADNDSWYEAMMGLASGAIDEAAFQAWLRDHVVPLG